MQIDSAPAVERDSEISSNSDLEKAPINPHKEETTKEEVAQNLNPSNEVQEQKPIQSLPNGHQILRSGVEEVEVLNSEEESPNGENNQPSDAPPESDNYAGDLGMKAVEDDKASIGGARDSTELGRREEPTSELSTGEESFELLKRLRKLVSDPSSELKNKNLITINSISKVIESYKRGSTTRAKQIEAEESCDEINGKRFNILEAEKRAFLSPKIFSLSGNNSQNGSKFKNSKSKGAAAVLKSKSVVSTLFDGFGPPAHLTRAQHNSFN